jgi:tRNA(Ile)-lysidine synthase
MRAGDRVAVAVSGGADSLALLRVLLELRDELGVVVSLAHFNHHLREEASDADQAFAADLSRQHGLEFFVGNGDVRDHALQCRQTLEAAARQLRYSWFIALAKSKSLNAIATGHTLDDQAETVLMKFLRGAGTRGLAGIYPALECGEGMISGAEARMRIVRPLLCVPRTEVESYLTALGQSWQEDASNRDRRFARNRIRHELLPQLEREYNPNFHQVLSDMAEVARADEEHWQEVVEQELEARQRSKSAEIPQGPTSGILAANDGAAEVLPLPQQRLSLVDFQSLALALQRRLLRRFGETEGLALDFEHVEKLRRCACGGLRRTELGTGWLAVRRGEYLELCSAREQPVSTNYEYSLEIPGEVRIAEIGAALRAVTVPEEFAKEAEPGTLLSAELLGLELTVRNWRPGDRFWPAHYGSEQKLKRLFSESHIPTEQRPRWPVVLKGKEIVWVSGFPVARSCTWSGSGDAVRIEIVPSGWGGLTAPMALGI